MRTSFLRWFVRMCCVCLSLSFPLCPFLPSTSDLICDHIWWKFTQKRHLFPYFSCKIPVHIFYSIDISQKTCKNHDKCFLWSNENHMESIHFCLSLCLFFLHEIWSLFWSSFLFWLKCFWSIAFHFFDWQKYRTRLSGQQNWFFHFHCLCIRLEFCFDGSVCVCVCVPLHLAETIKMKMKRTDARSSISI